MSLIANKPCSFGGRWFYIGDKIPANLVADTRMQERLGVITIANDAEKVPDGESGTFYTKEQLEEMVAEAVDEAVNNTVQEMEQKQKELLDAAGVLQEDGFLPGVTVIIPVNGDSSKDDGQQMAITATPEEIQQVFCIMQMNATDGVEAIAGVKSENVLMLLHTADTRKTIRDAAKKQADNIFPTSDNPNESTGDDTTTGTNTEGADT